MRKKIIKFNNFKKDAHIHKREYLSVFERVALSGWYILGNEVSSFEEEFAEYLGAKHCIGVANGLEAIQIALMSAGIGKGSEVVTTPLSAIATTLAILAVGAKPIFVDIKDDGQIDENLISSAISKKTRAVLPVHLYGQSCEVGLIKKICKDRKILLIEDAAQAHGASYKGKKLGTIGDIGAFSFYPTKNMGALGDGGCIVTSDAKIASNSARIRNYGQSNKYNHTTYGLNSRLDEFQAAILRKKLKRLDVENEKRRLLARLYRSHFEGVEQLTILGSSGNSNNCHLFVIRTKKRDKLKEFLLSKGIETLVHYPLSIPDQPMFANLYKDLRIPKARLIVEDALSLPCNVSMTPADVSYVCDNIKTFFNKR